MKKTFITALLVLAAANAVAAQDSHDLGAGVTKELRLTIREGNDFYNKGNYAKALESYEVALQLNPASQVALYNKALALINMAGEDTRGTENDPRAQGMQMLEQVARNCAVTDSPLAEKALYNLGNMAYNDQDYGRSIERYKQALKINPDNNRTRQNLRLAQLKQQNQDQDQNQDQNQDQQQQQQPMTQSAEQILQAMQNKENATRRKQQEPAQPSRYSTDKPW